MYVQLTCLPPYPQHNAAIRVQPAYVYPTLDPAPGTHHCWEARANMDSNFVQDFSERVRSSFSIIKYTSLGPNLPPNCFNETASWTTETTLPGLLASPHLIIFPSVLLGCHFSKHKVYQFRSQFTFNETASWVIDVFSPYNLPLGSTWVPFLQAQSIPV